MPNSGALSEDLAYSTETKMARMLSVMKISSACSAALCSWAAFPGIVTSFLKMKPTAIGTSSMPIF